METKRTYFHGLNALRFFAATLVIFHHLEQYKFWNDQSTLWGLEFIDALGHKPVGFFFVLSGFLITYLLLEENRRNKTIKISEFYLKRVFRIWPLYFVIVFMALVVLPLFTEISFGNLTKPDQPIVVISLLFMIPNLLRISFPNLIGANQLWSVGIEEQFYLFWPLLIKRYAGQVSRFLCLFIVIKLSVHLILVAALQFHEISWLIKVEKLYALFPIEQMAVGGLGASFLFHKKRKLLRYMESHAAVMVALLFIIISSFMSIDSFLYPTIEAIAFIVVVYQVTINKKIYRHLETKTLNYLGSISYGIYMWHTVAITISITTMDLLGWDGYLTACLLSLSITFILSFFSFKYLEHPFLQMRKQFSKIQFSKSEKLLSHAKS